MTCMIPPERGHARGVGCALLAGALVMLATVPAIQIARSSPGCDVSSYLANAPDALVFRVAAELLAQGRSPYDPALQAEHVARTRLDGEDPPYTLPFAYPPNALPLFMTYLAGAPRLGHVLFVFLGMVAMLAAAWQLIGLWISSPHMRCISVLAIGVSGPVMFNAEIGQTGTYLAAVVFWYTTSYERRPLLAGLALGLMAFKPQYALPLGVVALADRRWRTLLVATATFVACTLASGWLFGFHRWADFVQAIGHPNRAAPHMSNWVALWYRAGLTELAERVAIPVMILGCVVVFAYSVRGPHHPHRWIRNLGFATALTPLISAHTHRYDLAILIIPILAATEKCSQSTRVLLVLGFSILSSLYVGSGQRWSYPFVLTILLVAVMWMLDRPRRDSGPHPATTGSATADGFAA